ncbi:MAG TPA: cytochrome c-type biogenesis protein [Gammaproteobacteria bacterium]|nr:cytochrome c-type biogenesis protein [Gammaproteobacteria bacterium]
MNANRLAADRLWSGDRLRCLALVLLAAVVVAGPAWAVDGQAPFDSPVLEQRYQKLIHEIRCLECLDESIADSNAELAAQFRRQIHIQVAAGKSEQEIIDFLVARYGDFVIYRPPFQPNTWLLWGAPFILLAIGGIVFARIVRNRAAQPLDEDPIA